MLESLIDPNLKYAIKETMLNISGIKPELKSDSPGTTLSMEDSISSVVEILENHHTGKLTLVFPYPTLYFILEKIFKRPYTSPNAFVQESACEFTNIVYGIFRTRVNQQEFNFLSAIPNAKLGPPASDLMKNEGNVHKYHYTLAEHSFMAILELRQK